MSKQMIYDLRNVGCSYRQRSLFPWNRSKNIFWALEDISFQVYRGETVGIIGKNGAGKSTLLRLMAHIIEPSRGTLYRDRSIRSTLLSLGAGFDRGLSGGQNIYLNGLLLGMKKKEIDECYRDIIDLAELGDFIDQPVLTYSSGMRSRLGFAIAYYVNADVILIDETLSVGDGAFRLKSSELLKKKIQSDQTVILVTHSISTIRELCDRVVWLEHGRSMRQHGKDETLIAYDNYLKTGVVQPEFL
jgi:ABC transporter-related protein